MSSAGAARCCIPLPWDKNPDKFKRRAWADSDISAMYWYMEKGYKITKRNAIDAGLDIHAATHTFNEVQDFLKGLAWDGVPRLDTLFIDYLGADDSPIPALSPARRLSVLWPARWNRDASSIIC